MSGLPILVVAVQCSCVELCIQTEKSVSSVMQGFMGMTIFHVGRSIRFSTIYGMMDVLYIYIHLSSIQLTMWGLLRLVPIINVGQCLKTIIYVAVSIIILLCPFSYFIIIIIYV